MRALIADEHALNRAGLRNVLIRGGFEVVEVQDELGAACLLFQPDPPKIAFLATDTVLVDFATICKALRTADPGVYIVALVPDSREQDVLNFLKLGADDYMVKSRPITAVQARLKVILKNMERRDATRTEDAAVQASPEQPAPGEAENEAPASEVPAEPATPRPQEPKTLVDRFSLPAVVRALQAVMGGLGLEARLQSADGAPPGEALCAGWLPVVLLMGKTGEWVNIRLDFDAASTDALLRASREEAHATDAARLGAVREILNLLQAQLTALLPESSPVSFPLQPVSSRAEELPGGLLPTLARKQSARLSLGNGSFVGVTVAMQLLKSEERGLLELKPYDVLGAPLRAGRALTLLRAGVMLDAGYISRLQVLAKQQESVELVKVFRPPAGTLLALSKLTG